MCLPFFMLCSKDKIFMTEWRKKRSSTRNSVTIASQESERSMIKPQSPTKDDMKKKNKPNLTKAAIKKSPEKPSDGRELERVDLILKEIEEQIESGSYKSVFESEII